MAKILIATDGSEFAIGSARRALALLAPDCELTVLSVAAAGTLAPPALLADPGAGTVPPDGALVEEVEDAVHRQSEEAVRRTADGLGRAAETRVERGEPASEIVRVAEEGGFDLIVIGSHGWGLLKRALMGSVSHNVLHHAPCPVLMMRADAE